MREFGPARKELSGEEAAPYIGVARVLLGKLKNDMAFNKLSWGTRQQQLEDGTVIAVTSMYGADTFRILAPVPPPPPVLNAEVIEQKTGIGSEEEQIETDSSAPYLWVGARIVSGGADVLGATSGDSGRFVKLHLCVWEDDTAAPGHWAIISNRNALGIYGQPASEYPLGDNLLMPGGSAAGIPYTARHHCIGVDDQYPDWLTSVAANLKAPVQTLRNATYAPGTANKYDTVVFCDPDDRAGFNPFGTPKWASGKPAGAYRIKVMASADDCTNFTPVEVEVLLMVGAPGAHGSVTQKVQFTISEFTTYRFGMLPYGWFPPTGPQPVQECTGQGDYGANPHGPHWFQGGGSVFMPPPQVERPAGQYQRTSLSWTSKTMVPPTGFAAGSFPARDDRCRMCVPRGSTTYGLWIIWSAYNSDDTPGYYPGGPKPYGYHKVQIVSIGGSVIRGGTIVSTDYNIYVNAFGMSSFEQMEDLSNPGLSGVDINVPASVCSAPYDPNYQTSSIGPSHGGGVTAIQFDASWYWDAYGKFHGTAGGFKQGIVPVPPPTVTQYRVPYPYDNFDGNGNQIQSYTREWRKFPSSYDNVVGYGWPDPAEPTPP